MGGLMCKGQVQACAWPTSEVAEKQMQGAQGRALTTRPQDRCIHMPLQAEVRCADMTGW